MDLRVGGELLLARCSHDPLTDESVLMIIDLVGDPGAIVARTAIVTPRNEPVPNLGLVRGAWLTWDRGETQVRDVVTGALLHSTAGSMEALDDEVLVVLRPDDRLALLETLGGRQVWEVQLREQVASVLTAERLIVISAEEELELESPPRWRVQALDRAHGAPVWSRSLPRPKSPGFVSGYGARDVVYLVTSPRMNDSDRSTTVLALDEGTGALLWTRTLEEAVPPGGVQMECACPGGLLLLATGDRRTRLTRIGARSV